MSGSYNVKDELQGISSFEKSGRVMPCRFDPLVITHGRLLL